MLIDHQDQQIVRRKTQNLDLCFGTKVGTNQAKIEKISISRAILLEFLHSPVSTIRCEANKINRQREVRPIGSRAVKILRDLRRGARGPARHVAAASRGAVLFEAEQTPFPLTGRRYRPAALHRIQFGTCGSRFCSYVIFLLRDE